jgi:hypothetical protein
VSDPSDISLFLQGTNSSPHFNIEKYTVGREGERKYSSSKGNALSRRVDFALELRAHGKGLYPQVNEIITHPYSTGHRRLATVGFTRWANISYVIFTHHHSLSLQLSKSATSKNSEERDFALSNIYPIPPLLARSFLRAPYMSICHIAHIVSDE